MSSKTNTSWEDLLSFKNDSEKNEHLADMMSLKIALHISAFIKDRGVSKKELATLMGTSPAYITQILRGDKRINMIFLAKLMHTLDLRLDFELRANRQSDEDLFDRILDMPRLEQETSYWAKVIDFPGLSVSL